MTRGWPLAGFAGALGAALVLAIPRAGAGGAYPDRAPLAHTGGFGEPTCAQCHFGSPPNAAGGKLAVAGVPVAYRPGARYRLTVTLEKPGLAAGGFQLSARFAEGAAAGRQAGALRAVDGRAQVLRSAASVEYAGHTEEGPEPPRADAAEWVVEWTAPAEAAGPVRFHLSANAGNGDGSAFGDFIYTAQALSRGGE